MFLRVHSSVWGQLTNGSALVLCPEKWDLLIFLSPYSRCFLLPALLLLTLEEAAWSTDRFLKSVTLIAAEKPVTL